MRGVISLKGDFDENVTYLIGNIVANEGSLYIALQDSPAGLDTAGWRLLVLNSPKINIGNTNPTSSLGEEGDIYINYATSTVWERGVTSWTERVLLQGPPGAQGNQGPAGQDGEDGTDGATGAAGQQGPQGATGQQGPARNTGGERVAGRAR